MRLYKKAVFLSLLLLIQSGFGILGAALALEGRYTGLIQQGVTVKGIPLEGLNPFEAAQKLESALPSLVENTLEIKGAGRSYLICLSDIDAEYDYLSTAEEALKHCKKGNYVNQLMSILATRAKPVDLPVKITFSEEKLAEKLKYLQSEWEIPPKDAAIDFSNEKVVIIPEKTGYSLDFEETMEQARLALAGGNLHAAASGRSLEPKLSSAALEGIDALLSEYTTTFDDSDRNRSHNIILASAAVNGSLVKPGEVFSLNQRLGPRLADKGYLKAPVFIDNRLALDTGGGVCQVATTLYNAVLLADLTVVERHSHPSPVGYVSPGRDATISWDSQDLKFANNLDAPVYIASLIEPGTLTVRVFGAAKKDGRTVRIVSENNEIEPKVVFIHDNTLPEGETRVRYPGKAGFETRTFREIVVNGQVESRTLISSDYYKPVDKVILVGPKPEEESK